MRDHLAGLHDAHNGRLGLVSPIGRDALMRLFIFFLSLLGLDLVDLDAVLGVGEVRVDGKGVGVIDVFALGRLAEYPVFGACEGLQGSLELHVIWQGNRSADRMSARIPMHLPKPVAAWMRSYGISSLGELSLKISNTTA